MYGQPQPGYPGYPPAQDPMYGQAQPPMYGQPQPGVPGYPPAQPPMYGQP